MFKAVSLGGRASTLKELATAFKTLNEASAPQGKKAAAQGKADAIGARFRPLGPPSAQAGRELSGDTQLVNSLPGLEAQDPGAAFAHPVRAALSRTRPTAKMAVFTSLRVA